MSVPKFVLHDHGNQIYIELADDKGFQVSPVIKVEYNTSTAVWELSSKTYTALNISDADKEQALKLAYKQLTDQYVGM